MSSYIRPLVLLTLALPYCGCLSRPPAGPAQTALAEAPSRPQQVSVAEWTALSKPGPSHQLLDLFAGDWDTTMSFWRAPDEQPEISRGRSQLTWILGKRFLKEEFRGQAGGEPFQGVGLMGYDSGARRFTNVWIDSLNTAMATATGKYFAEHNRFEFIGEVFDPLLGRNKSNRSTIQIRSSDEYQFVMTDTTPQGKEYTAIEIIYTRQK